MRSQNIKTSNRTRTNLYVDIAIFVAFLVATAPHMSGLAIHEWLGLAFGAGCVTHLLLHWNWLVEVTRRFFGKMQWSVRINYILNALLFITMTLLIFSGLMISENIVPLLGLATAEGGIWRGIHSLATNISLALIGLHAALHWLWIVNASKRFLGLGSSKVAKPVQQPTLQK